MKKLPRILSSLLFSVASCQTIAAPIANGDSIIGTISSPSVTHQYTFHAEPNDKISVSMADLDGTADNVAGDLYPVVEVLSPSNVRLGLDFDRLVAYKHAMETNESGLHTIIVGNYEGNGTGRYELHLASAPGASEHGGLPNGGSVLGTITLGDIDSYSFHAEQGETASLMPGRSGWWPTQRSR